MVDESQSDNIARVRLLEGKYAIFGERLLIINQNMIAEYKKISQNIKELHRDINELREELDNTKEVIKKMVKEINQFARLDDVKVLEKYINLWNPMNFVTENEVLDLIKQGDSKSQKKSQPKK